MRTPEPFHSKPAALLLILCLSFSGCSTLKPEEYSQYGYKGEAVVKEGAKVVPIDWIGNFFGIFQKLVLWNWKMKRHNIQPDTEQAVQGYLSQHPEIGDLAVQLNRYAPQDDWKRLVRNKGVKWPYRLLLGTLSVLIIDTLLIGRIFGGDYYNPFTHSVHIYSDLPSVALHELGHAKDFGDRRYRGSYALFRILPFADLYQEYQATHLTLEHARETVNTDLQIESYNVLYPAYGTYVGGYLLGYGTVFGAVIGHIWGRSESRQLKQELARAKTNP